MLNSLPLRLIAIQSVEGTAPTTDADGFSGLAGASAAYLDHRVPERLAGEGATIESIVAPALDPESVADDRIVNLGQFNALIAAQVSAAIASDVAPLLMGGTCRHLIGMIAGLQQTYGATSRIGLIWLDAHGDFNTPRTSRSGMLGGMPVAVAAGLCLAPWREAAGQLAPLPTDRIVMVDVRNLDPDEETLIRSTDVEIARFGDRFATEPVTAAIDRLAARCDHLYLHVDADILDATLQPNHPTAEAGGPDVAAVQTVMDHAFRSGKVRAFGLVSVNPDGPDGAVSLASGIELLRGGVASWVAHGQVAV